MLLLLGFSVVPGALAGCEVRGRIGDQPATSSPASGGVGGVGGSAPVIFEVEARASELLERALGGSGGAHGGSGGASSSGASSSSSASSSSGAGGCDPAEPIDTSPIAPAALSATGLYADIAGKSLADHVEPFTPSFPLWSDGAEKARFVHLPACNPIDTGDMDHWSVPVGTKLWKEFVVAGLRVETRYLHRFGPGPDDFVFAAYAWSDDESDAAQVTDGGGLKNARGTGHDIPGNWECDVCHGHAPEHVIGLSALQLSHGGPGLTIASLSAAGRLTVPAPAGFSVPGDAIERAALGYLHGNCGHCHNRSPKAVWFDNPYSLKLLVGQTSVSSTDTFLTAVGVPVEKFKHPGIAHRITAGDPASSCVSYRMSVRGNDDQMPALGTKVVDPTGLAAVDAWIAGLP